MIKRYIAYLKDNPEGYWFKPKLYGWGWTPAKWQGWLATVLYIASIIILVSMSEAPIPGNPDSGSNFLTLGVPVIILTGIFIFIAYKKGEKPRWQWGLPSSSKNKTDEQTEDKTGNKNEDTINNTSSD